MIKFIMNMGLLAVNGVCTASLSVGSLPVRGDNNQKKVPQEFWNPELDQYVTRKLTVRPTGIGGGGGVLAPVLTCKKKLNTVR